MTVYPLGVFLLNYLIDFLLIAASNRLCGLSVAWIRSLLGALVGSTYATLCMTTNFAYLSQPGYRMVLLTIASGIAFGLSFSGIRRMAVFLLLNMALGGLSLGADEGGLLSMSLAAVGVLLLCGVGFMHRPWKQKIVTVEILHNDEWVKLKALCDSGNLLRDPISGGSVLVVGRDVCEKLTGLSCVELRNPIETISKASIPGLRLIPYKTIGQSKGILLGLYFPAVKIGSKMGGSVVAFSPEILCYDGTYQALTGGMS